MVPRRTLAAALLAGGLLLSACQSAPEAAIEASGERCPPESDCFDPVEPVGPGSSIQVEGFEWDFDVQGNAVDGTVTVEFMNTGGTVHNFRIDGAVGETKEIEAPAGESATGELKLFGGTEYTYYCSIPGHRANGMEGTITVYLPGEEPTGSEAPTEGEGA